MFPRRDVFVILDVIISFRDGERAEPARLEVKTGNTQQSLVVFGSCTASLN
jgi:hypothetical protein